MSRDTDSRRLVVFAGMTSVLVGLYAWKGLPFTAGAAAYTCLMAFSQIADRIGRA
jgi:hypothetical protein